MSASQEQFSVREIDFLAPDIETAEHLFGKVMGLKTYLKGKSHIIFYLNNTTRLNCKNMQILRQRQWVWSKIDLRTSTKKLLDLAKKLEKDRMFKSVKVKGKKPLKLVTLNTKTYRDGRKIHILQITTPKQWSTVVISDFN